MSIQINNSKFGVCENNYNMIEVAGDYREFITDDGVLDYNYLIFSGMEIESVDEESMILEITDEDNFYLRDLDGCLNIISEVNSEVLKKVEKDIETEEWYRLKEKAQSIIDNNDGKTFSDYTYLYKIEDGEIYFLEHNGEWKHNNWSHCFETDDLKELIKNLRTAR